MQLKIYIPKHPLIEHLTNVMQTIDIPSTLLKSSAIELTYWLCYEAMRSWMSLADTELKSLDGISTARLISSEKKVLVLPFVKSGLLMSESVNKLFSHTDFFYVSFKNEKLLCDIIDEDKSLLNNISHYSGFLILDSIVLDSHRILAILSFMVSRGVDLSVVRITFLICTSEVLRDIGQAYPNLIIYTSCVKDISKTSDLLPYRSLLESLQT